MVEVLKEILFLLLVISPIWIFVAISIYGYIKINLDNIKIYKKYFNQLKNMVFYKDGGTIFGYTNDNNYGVSYFEDNWCFFLKSSILEPKEVHYGVNPFKNYWYNKITKLISSKKIYSYYEYKEYRDVIYKIEQRNLLLDKILSS